MSRLSGEAHAFEAELLQLEQEQRWELHHFNQSNSRECFRVHVPQDAQGIATPESALWLDRDQIAGSILPKRNDSLVTDTRKCCGPFVASIDRSPLVLLDTRDHGLRLDFGFANQKLIQAVYRGDLDHCLWNNPSPGIHEDDLLRQLRSKLLATTPQGLEHLCWAMGGIASAHDKALRIARMQSNSSLEDRNQVLCIHPQEAKWISTTCSQFHPSGFEPMYCAADLQQIVSSLQNLSRQLYAVLLSSDCFIGKTSTEVEKLYTEIYKLAHRQNLPLLYREELDLFRERGTCFSGVHPMLNSINAMSPDMLISGEVHGLGMIFTSMPDPEPEPLNVLAVACSLSNWQMSPLPSWRSTFIESNFQSLAKVYPNLIRYIDITPSSLRMTFANASTCDLFVHNSLPNGFLLQRESDCQVKFVLNLSFEEKRLRNLVQRIESCLSDTIAHPDKIPRSVRRYSSARRNCQLRIQEISESHWPQIMAIEREVYEPARVDTEETLRKAVRKGMGLAALDQQTGEVLGFCIGGNIEDFRHLDGPKQDDRNGLHDSFYSADLAVSSRARGLGIGRMLKEQQLERARTQGFKFVTGRNRIGATEEMSGLNRSLGAFPIMRLSNQYGGDAQADYYRIPLQPPIPKKAAHQKIDWASGLQSPFGSQPSMMKKREWIGPLSTRVNLSTSTTPDIIHYREHLMKILPRGTSRPYFAGSRDHALELCLQCFSSHRPSASTMITLEQGYFGQISAASRSLTDPSDFSRNFTLFDWPRIPHPQRTSVACTIHEMTKFIDERGSPSILAFICELCGERSGNCIEDLAAKSIHSFCRFHHIPLIWVETATGGYRNGTGKCWASSNFSEEVRADAVIWYPGGQLAHVFVSEQFQLSPDHPIHQHCAPDELSAIRCHEHLRAAWKLDFLPTVSALDRLLNQLAHLLNQPGSGATIGGTGLYRSLSLSSRQQNLELHSLCRQHGLLLGHGIDHSLLLIPPLDCHAETVSGVVAPILEQACKQLMEDQHFGSSFGSGSIKTS